jgi:dipeptidyl aminopeptidase/acylaminoacyl peptidase
MTDPQLHDRLHRAADPIDLDPEARLDTLHAGARRHARRRRTSGLVAGLVVVALVSAVIWQMRPGGGRVAASNTTPTGTLAYVRFGNGGNTMSAHAFTFDGRDVEVPVTLNDVPFVYSPDGTQLAYAQRAGDGTAITIANADGSNSHEVGQGLSAEQIAWGPDGATMALVAPKGTGGGGSDVSILDLVAGDVTPLPKLHGHSWNSIAWSPDGASIALAGELAFDEVGNTVPAGGGGLFVAPSDGSAAPTSLLDNANVEFLDWAPDSSKVAYGVRDNADMGDYRWDIGVVNADGTGQALLTDFPGWDKIGVWSPDGQWIAFSSDRGASPEQQRDNADNTAGSFGGLGIYIMRSDGSEVTPLMIPEGDGLMAPTDWKA